MSNLLIIGAGGHGKVVADTARESRQWNKIAFLDDKFPKTTSILNWNILEQAENAQFFLTDYTEIIVAVGDNTLRAELLEKYKRMGFGLASVIHPTAFVSKDAEIGEGSVVFAQSVINAGAKIGSGAIINTAATVDHDCVLANGVHISPGVHLAGGVKIGAETHVGIGASIIQMIEIGDRVIIGAGAAVIYNIPSNSVAVGVPAKVIK